MRRTAALLATAAIASTLILLGVTPASAADPVIPPPVTHPVYDMPSTWQPEVLTDQEAALRKHEIDLASRADSAKWWGRPAKLLKLGAGGLAYFGLGWQIGVGVLTVHSAATGNVENYCQTPDWYRDTSLLTFFGPMVDCPTIPFLTPNSDITPGTSLTYGATNVVYQGTGPGTFCYSQSASLPAGYAFQFQTPGGTWSTGGTSLSHYGPNCPGFAGYYIYASTISSSSAIRVLGPGSTVVATMATASANPNRQARCSISFDDGAPKQYSAWVPYTENAGFPSAAFATACDTKAATLAPERTRHVRSIGVEEQTDGGAITEIAESEAPSEYDEQREIMESQGGRASLLLLKTIAVGTEINCLSGTTACADWWEDTDEGTITGPYRCVYGTMQVDLLECAVYKRSFQEGTDTAIITDPITDEDISWGSETSPGNSINPGTGPGTSPGDACMASWSATANPIEWVLHPVKCALVWAFVPRTSVTTAARTATENAWDASTPGKLYAAVAAVGPALGALGNGNCGGLIVPAPVPGPDGDLVIENHAILAACPGDFFADWAPGFFWFNTITLIFGGFFAVRRMLDRFVGNA